MARRRKHGERYTHEPGRLRVRCPRCGELGDLRLFKGHQPSAAVNHADRHLGWAVEVTKSCLFLTDRDPEAAAELHALRPEYDAARGGR